MKENDPYEQGALFTFGEAEHEVDSLGVKTSTPSRSKPKTLSSEPSLWECADVPIEDLAPNAGWPKAEGSSFFAEPWVPEGFEKERKRLSEEASVPAPEPEVREAVKPARKRTARKKAPETKAELFEYETCNAPDLWEEKKEAGRAKTRARPKKSLKMRAVEALSRCEYTRKTLRSKLLRSLTEDESPEKLDDVLDELERLGYLSDERYARVRTRGKAAGLGDRRLKQELLMSGVKAGVASAVIEREIEPERIRCYRLWKRRFGELPSDAKEKDKQTRWLAYRGFGFSAISDVLRGRIEVDEDGEPLP